MRRWLLIPALLAALTACTNNNNDPRPTEIRVITVEPTIEIMQATIDAQASQIAALGATSTALAQATVVSMANTPGAPLGTGTVISETAVILAEANADAPEIGTAPQDATLTILEETEPNRVGMVFYRVQYADLTGWVASTQLTSITPAAETPPAADTTEVASVPTEPAQRTNTPVPTMTALIPAPTSTYPTTPLPEGFPTPQIYSVEMVEQLFEGGRMLWFQPNRQIWVLMGDEGKVDPTSGVWMCFDDTFVEGEPERLATMDPPMGTANNSSVGGSSLMQPIRGFGKVWRSNPEVREGLGWALLPEALLTTRFEYVPGGEMVDDEYEAADGQYHIVSLFQYTLILEGDSFETPCEDKDGTWRILE